MVILMSEDKQYTCIHEEQIQGQSRKIASLETRADYKEKIIMGVKDDIKDLKDSVESLDKTITDFILKSINDDSTLRELVNKQDNRITALETTNKTLKWAVGLGFTGLTSAVAVMAFIMAHLH